MSVVRKYLNYLIFGAVVLLVVGLAVQHSRHMHDLVEDMAGNDPNRQEAAALELVKGEQFSDTISGEPVRERLKSAESLELLANDVKVVKGMEKDAPDYRSLAVKQILGLLKDTDKTVRQRAVEAMQHCGTSSPANLKEFVVGLKDGDNYIRKGTISALTDPQSGVGPKLDAANKIDVIQAIVDLMKAEGGARGPGGDVLASHLFKPDAARSRSLQLLYAQMNDKDGGVRQGAADALGKIGDVTAIPNLKIYMHSDADPQVRRVAIGSIALIANQSGEDALSEAINDPGADNEARIQSAVGLGKIGTPTAIATLMKALEDDDLKLRSAAVTALSSAARPKSNGPVNSVVIAALTTALKGQNEDARRGAAQALQIVASPEVNAPLIALLMNDSIDTTTRSSAATALGFSNNTPAVAPLIMALSFPNGDVNAAARDSLATIGATSIDPLVNVIQKNGSAAYYASEALAHQGVSALPALQRVASGTNQQAQHWAAVSLGELVSSGVPGARKPLELLAKSGDPDVQYVAQEQLTRLGSH